MARRFTSAGGEQIIAKINVTPIIDVCLVLVIILLVTAPLMTAADVPIDLPQAHTREAEDERNVSVTLGSDGSLAVDDERVTPESLPAVLQARLAEPGNSDVLVVVRADSDAPYARIKEILNQTRTIGAKRVAIATRQKVEVLP
ncbi:MAG TPA: biopolymer transporter ExbD [Candidatus Eisenbacteria bacterium]|jgi:biopolymer transport protein ExbD|nr:biopolymer transporter ExbD [Candidatus Eisenbacteria bacterium]